MLYRVLVGIGIYEILYDLNIKLRAFFKYHRYDY